MTISACPAAPVVEAGARRALGGLTITAGSSSTSSSTVQHRIFVVNSCNRGLRLAPRTHTALAHPTLLYHSRRAKYCNPTTRHASPLHPGVVVRCIAIHNSSLDSSANQRTTLPPIFSSEPHACTHARTSAAGHDPHSCMRARAW